ncbi:MAG: S9 family peptidase [Rhodoferax sp.]|nr:S9 family peptidase [Rhodoferax sp.]MDP3650870.1 S9 family peptidase [Rhodoferax sp.]
MQTFSQPTLAAATLCVALLSGCSTAPTHPGLRDAQTGQSTLPPLVPVRTYVANWDGNGGYQLSADGKQLMWVARKGLGPGLFVKNLQTGAVRSYGIPAPGLWAEDSRHVLFQLDNGNENTHVYQLDTFADGTNLKDLTPFAGSKSFIQSLVQNSSDLLIANNQRNAKVFDLYRYDQASGKLNLLAENPGSVARWLTDKAGHVLGRARKDADQWVYETPSDASNTQWHAVFRVDDADTVRPLEVSADKKFLWALSNRGRDKLALVKVDLRNGAEQVVYADPRVDISQALISTQTLEPLAVALDPNYQEWKFFDPKLQAAANKLRGTAHTRLDFDSISRDGNLIVASVKRETGGETVLYTVSQDQTLVLGEHTRSRIHALGDLPQQKPLQFQSRDGLELHGYLTLPGSSHGKAFPTVVYVHGGPWSRDFASENDPMPLFLANRGYAVLQVNYRGSSGYGRAFMEAAKGEFAGKMHTDLLDGIDHLVAQGVSDPHKVAIMGTSYGGYASMVGMAFTPDRFSCGISMVGMSDLASLLDSAPPYWDLDKPRWVRYLGDPAKPEDRAVMDAKSPLHRAAQVRGPMLVLHGARDVRVKVEQSTRLVDALNQAGKPVDFHVYKNAGHGLHRWPDNLSYFRKTEDFLAQCLGGRSSGFDFYQLGSWAL